MLRNLVLLLSMITSAGGGWWLGSWSGRDAKSALAEAEVKGKLAAAEHDEARNVGLDEGELLERLRHRSASDQSPAPPHARAPSASQTSHPAHSRSAAPHPPS